MAESRARGHALRCGIALALAGAYALPLFLPPATPVLGAPTPPDAWLLRRIFPGVPAWWVAFRLAALAGAAWLLAATQLPPSEAADGTGGDGACRPTERWIALALAAFHLAVAPFAARLGPAGQVAYVVALGAPAAVLAWAEGLRPLPIATTWRMAAPTALVILVWTVSRFVTDFGSPRTADVIDGWRAFLDTVRAVQQRENVLTALFDPKLPGISGLLFVFQGVPVFQAEVVPFSLRAVQVFQTFAVAATAAGVALLARILIAPEAAALAAAVFLFAPFTRFTTFFPGPFLAGPLYAVVVALAALLAARRRSEAGLAGLGAVAGAALGYPSSAPFVAVAGAWTLWTLRTELRRLGVGIAAGLLSFAAVVVPAVPNVYTPSRVGSHFRWDGLIAVIDAGLLGQLPLRETAPAFVGVAQRPADIVVSALLAPFASPRVAIRLWGDALFEPVGAVLFAVGLIACLRAWRSSWLACALLVTCAVVIAPALVSPVDVANVTYAVVLPVAVALVAAVGLVALPLASASRRRLAPTLILAVAVGGTLLFDVVNPRTIPASAFGIMFDAVDHDALRRVVVLGYGPDFVRPTRTLYTGPITHFVGREPVGYLEYDGGALPVTELEAEGKDLLFWSHGYDRDVAIGGAICAAWPAATLYEIRDRSGLARVHAARLGSTPWEPAAARARWQSRSCGAA